MSDAPPHAPTPPPPASAREPVRLARYGDALRPYRAAFAARFSSLLQYRGAALAGVATQVWWGGIKVMVLAAFYPAPAHGGAPLSLSNAITYVWTAQALFALMPWVADPDVVQAVRSGSVAFDGVRPVDPYAFWFARSAGWLAARTLPRALLLGGAAALGLRAVGLTAWAWQGPASVEAGLVFCVSLVLALLLSTAALMWLNVAVVALLDERGVNALAAPVILAFSGNLLPLGLYPDGVSRFLLLQPLAGILDIPLRIYFGELEGQAAAFGLGLQLFWTSVLVLTGRSGLLAALRRLEVQGG
jgi:ABC-2 type transport system permease protein